MFALAAVGLIYELIANPRTRARSHRAGGHSRGFVADYAAVLSNPWARIVILVGVHRSRRSAGARSPIVGADLHLRFGLSFTAVGLIVGTFAIGGLIYAGSVQQLVNRFGQRGLAVVRRRAARHRLSRARDRARRGGSRRSR